MELGAVGWGGQGGIHLLFVGVEQSVDLTVHALWPLERQRL